MNSMKTFVSALVMLAATPYAFGHAGRPSVEDAPPASASDGLIRRCLPLEYVENDTSGWKATPEVLAEMQSVYNARAATIVAALKPTLAAAGVAVNESTARFVESQDGNGYSTGGWMLRFESASGSKLRLIHSSLLPMSSDAYSPRTRPAPTIYEGEREMLSIAAARPVARVAQGFDGEGNLSVCNVIGAEITVTAVLNFDTGIAIAPNMAPVVVPSAVITQLRPRRDATRGR